MFLKQEEASILRPVWVVFLLFLNHALNLSGLEPFTKIVKMDFPSLKYTLEMFSTIDYRVVFPNIQINNHYRVVCTHVCSLNCKSDQVMSEVKWCSRIIFTQSLHLTWDIILVGAQLNVTTCSSKQFEPSVKSQTIPTLSHFLTYQ